MTSSMRCARLRARLPVLGMAEQLDIRMPQKMICGRMNCNLCGAWRHIYEFPTQHARGKVYVKAQCKVCNNRRRKRWYMDKTPEERRELNRHQNDTQRLMRKRQQAKLLLGKAVQLANGRADAWPVRNWLMMELGKGRPIEELAFALDVSEQRVEDLARGFEEISDCNFRPIRTVEAGLLERTRKDAIYRIRDEFNAARRESR